MSEVNVELYELLKNRECHLCHNSNEDSCYPIIAWACLYHWDIEDFCKILGRNYFDEDGMDCVMRYDYVVVDLNDIIIEWFEHKLSSYANCFEDWWRYKHEILELEKNRGE